MVFSSLYFMFIFLPAVFVLTLIIRPVAGKNIVLLVGSIVFYAWGEPVYIVLMLFSILINYVCGIELGRHRDEPGKKKADLVFALIMNLFILGFFKYYGFLVETANSLFHADFAVRSLALPIGISFYTFQALSYVIDTYRGRVGVQKNPLNFALYITMFPQLIAGPIVRYADIEKQLSDRKITAKGVGEGVERLILGLGKKVLLANNLGLLYETIQGLEGRSVSCAWIGIIAYTLQIYFDFSGYSDMAIGMGKMFGFEFLENFNYPYIARSVTEFWRRWHMSLSTWFKEYVYIPLGGNRCSAARHVFNLLIVWFLTGLWHGAGWNFVLWGLYYGMLLILEKYVYGKALEKLPLSIRRLYTLFIVALGWVFFSITDFSEMGAYLGNLFGIGASGLFGSAAWYYLKSNIVLFLIAFVCSTPALYRWFKDKTRRRPVFTIVVLVIIFLVSTAYMVSNSYNPFLYFRF